MEIDYNSLIKFQKEYEKEIQNKKIEKEIREKGIKKACLNEKKAQSFLYKFNIEIPETKIYDQKNSFQCSIYAFLRVIKGIIIKENPNIDYNQLNLSANYFDFYDKLEKINIVYNKLINSENISYSLINTLTNRYVGVYGTFHFCKELINKYGFVPEEAMEEASDSYNAFTTLEFLKAKIKSDAISLMNKNFQEKKEIKEKLMKEAYCFLSKIMGNPPLRFKYQNSSYTPLTFKEKLLKVNLNDFKTVTYFTINQFKQSYAYVPNIYLNTKEEIKTESVNKIHEAVLKQLEDGIPVWISVEETTTLDYDWNVLDNEMFEYEEKLKIKEIKKEEKLLLEMINYDHAMCITGALKEKNKGKQWKVENSFGEHGIWKGNVIMSNCFFETGILTFIIHKKYL